VPLYRFDLKVNDQPWSDDQAGLELASVEQARRTALTLAGEVTKEQILDLHEVCVRVRDEGAVPLIVVRIAVKIETRL
jgi:hypothetical protein